MSFSEQFVKNQDRTYFNIHRPIELAYDESLIDYNDKNIEMPTSEVDRQTGSGKFSWPREKKVCVNYGCGCGCGCQGGSGKFSWPKEKKVCVNYGCQGGSNHKYALVDNFKDPAMNNFDQSVKAPINQVYLNAPRFQIHSQGQKGSGPEDPEIKRHYPEPLFTDNPAINNWLPGTSITEPMNTYLHSPQLQIHSKPSDPIMIKPNIGYTIQGRLSSDDWKSFNSTQPLYNSFRHIPLSQNPPEIK